MALQRLAKHYENGAKKYSSEIEIASCEVTKFCEEALEEHYNRIDHRDINDKTDKINVSFKVELGEKMKQIFDYWYEFADIAKDDVDKIQDEPDVSNIYVRLYTLNSDGDVELISDKLVKTINIDFRFPLDIDDMINSYWEQVNESLVDYTKSEISSFPLKYQKKFGYTKFIEEYDGGRNWEKGMPFSRYIDSAMRHLTQFLAGETNEDHLAAACWNIFAIMHHQEMGEWHLDNLPHYRK